MLIRITYKHLCFGLEADGKYVVSAAPCAAWTKGKTLLSVLIYWNRRGALIERIHLKL